MRLPADAAGRGLSIGPAPGVLNWQMHLVILPLAILGGLGSPVLMELVAMLRMKGGLSNYSKTVLAGTGWVYLVVFGLILVVQFVEMDSPGWNWLKVFASSSTAAIDSRTAGLSIEGAQPGELPRSAQWLLLPAMMLGGWAAGTAGGIKINTFIGLGRGISQGLRGGSIWRPVGLAAGLVGAYPGVADAVFFYGCRGRGADLA